MNEWFDHSTDNTGTAMTSDTEAEEYGGWERKAFTDWKKEKVRGSILSCIVSTKVGLTRTGL